MQARLDGTALTGQEVMFTSNTPQKGGRHFGCRIGIAGGDLYLSIGDRGARDDSQNMQSHSGAVIRIPRAGGAASIFTKGHRNPQGMAFHPATGGIWVGEHGPKGGDEINILSAGQITAGLWSVMAASISAARWGGAEICPRLC